MVRSREHEPEGRGIRSAVGAALSAARDARHVRLDLHRYIRRTYRMGYYSVHNYGYAILVARTRVHRVDMRRPAHKLVLDHKVTDVTVVSS